MRKLFLVLITTVLLSSFLSAQTKENKWLTIKAKGTDKISIDTTELDKYKGDDIYVWVKYEHKVPLTIEMIKDKIYRTHTYYLINKKLKKYSIIQIVYFDREGNVLKSFSYNRKSDNQSYQYNYPIIKDSDMDLILKFIENNKIPTE